MVNGTNVRWSKAEQSRAKWKQSNTNKRYLCVCINVCSTYVDIEISTKINTATLGISPTFKLAHFPYAQFPVFNHFADTFTLNHFEMKLSYISTSNRSNPGARSSKIIWTFRKSQHSIEFNFELKSIFLLNGRELLAQDFANRNKWEGTSDLRLNEK